MDERLTRIKALIEEIEEKETELNTLMGGGGVAKTRERAVQKCGICNEIGHTARTCTKQNQLPV
jgi:hypothetical protein